MLTICYMTNRLNPRYCWFVDSLFRETGDDWGKIKLVVVDFHAEAQDRDVMVYEPRGIGKFVHCPPKPNVWQGKYKITGRDYFAAAVARNTALCHVEDDYLAFVDDLSVLMPGWYNRVKLAVQNHYIAAGAYKKVLNLVVENGYATSWTEYPPGNDSRWNHGGDDPVLIGGGSMFGASIAGPVEPFLRVNGFDEDCCTLGFEDSICGLMIQQHGFQIYYDRRMLTYESEEAHHTEETFARFDKGVSPNDKSHAILGMVLQRGRTIAPNYFGEGGIRAVRKRILAGEPFPITQVPEHDWYDGEPLKGLTRA